MNLRAVLIVVATLGALSATAGAQGLYDDYDFDHEEFNFSWDNVAPKVDVERERYEAQLAIADQYATAAVHESDWERRIAFTKEALEAYEAAIEILPDEPDPHYRAGMLLYNSPFDKNVGTEIIRYWNELERLIPLDPRVTSILFQRALTHTRMATDEHTRKGIDDYVKLLRRQDINTLHAQNAGIRLNNLAEMYMMIGELETSIATYERALSYSSDVSFAFGLAVALDRDEQGIKAREVMADYIGGFNRFVGDVQSGQTFYVPKGEEYYYMGMAYEAMGLYGDAILSFQQFIDSGAHPRYHARAKDNIADITVKKAEQTVVPPVLEGYGF